MSGAAVVLVLVETADDAVTELSLQALAAGGLIAGRLGAAVHALVIAGVSDSVAGQLAGSGVGVIHSATHDLLTDYGPELWGATVAGLIAELRPGGVVAAGSDRGAEVMAQAAARQDLPLVANVTEVGSVGDGPMALTRVRWGGSLLEHTTLDADVQMLTVQPHAFAASPFADPVEPKVEVFTPDLDGSLVRTRVVDRVVTSTGVTLAEAPVVVGGGRGVGSAEGFAPLQELADLLGGRVGCSRVVTNNGWRPHADQVGQTGTAIAPQIYIACGISGAIQHWAGAKGAKHVLAINTDPDANMVSRADYAVIADLHEVVPAIIEEVRSRRAAG